MASDAAAGGQRSFPHLREGTVNMEDDRLACIRAPPGPVRPWHLGNALQAALTTRSGNMHQGVAPGDAYFGSVVR
jgi:hypothetical protein